MEGGNFKGKGRLIVKYSDTAVICSKTIEPIEMPFGLWTWVVPRNHVLDGAQVPHARGHLFGGNTCPGMPDDTVQ